MTEMCTVDICANPAAPGSFLCSKCDKALEQVLTESSWLLDELDLVLARQTRYSSARSGPQRPSRDDTEARRAKVGAAAQALPLDLTATAVRGVYVTKLETWVRLLMETIPTCPTYPTASSYADWLQLNRPAIRTDNRAGEMVSDLSGAFAAAQYVVDRPLERWFAGVCSATVPLPHGSATCDCACHRSTSQPCDEPGGCKPAQAVVGECPERLYADTSTGMVTCRSCGTHHDIAQRRDVLLSEAQEVLATASEAARAVVVWSDYERGENKLVKRISMWAVRGRIETKGHVVEFGQQRPLYRIGDILDLLADDVKGKSA